MASGFRHLLAARVVTGAGLGLTVILSLVLVRSWNGLPPLPAPETRTPKPLDFAETRAGTVTGSAWSVFAAPAYGPGGGAPAGNVRRFRLAGTFFVDGTDAQVRRKAILDDTVRREQQIVSEGDTIAEARVERILYDHVVLRIGGTTEEVWLDFSRSHGPVTVTNAVVAVAPSVGTNRFGAVRLQSDRWQFSRQGLLSYYQELMDEPDRMVAIFDSLKPVRAADDKITGYVVGVEGEADFFKAVGLNNGDIVRQVNSVPMTSRRRAEFFIDQFLKDRMNVLILDVERDGQTGKQVYLVRP